MTMKNVHVIPTDKPSRLHLGNSGLVLCDLYYSSNTINSQHIYITDDSEIKEGDWIIWNNKVVKAIDTAYYSAKKIILTTDQDLISEGVQAIDNEFLEWFIKNPSCERVEVGYGVIRLTETDNKGYWISTGDTEFNMQIEEPNYNMKQEILSEMERLENEESKQETLEEAAEREYKFEEDSEMPDDREYQEFIRIFKKGAKWQQERMYSEEEVVRIIASLLHTPKLVEESSWEDIAKWFEQFKKK